MTLVISSKHKLSQLETWVRSTFAFVHDKQLKLPNLALPIVPFTKDNLGIKV